MRGAILRVGVVLVAAAALAASSSKREQEEAKKAIETAAPAEVVTVTAAQLQRDYDANEVAADEQYRGKILRISGTVDEIGKDITDSPYVMLRTKDFGGVQCLFDEIETPRRLKKRQKVAFRCIGSGYAIGNPLVRHCIEDDGAAPGAPGGATAHVYTLGEGAIQDIELFAKTICSCSDVWCSDDRKAAYVSYLKSMPERLGKPAALAVLQDARTQQAIKRIKLCRQSLKGTARSKAKPKRDRAAEVPQIEPEAPRPKAVPLSDVPTDEIERTSPKAGIVEPIEAE